MIVIKYKNIFLTIASVVVTAAIVVVAFFGLSLGIDFTGGSILEVSFSGERPAIAEVEADVAEMGIESASVRPTDEAGYIIRTPFLEEGQRGTLLEMLNKTANETTSQSNQATTSQSTTTTTSTTAESTTTTEGTVSTSSATVGSVTQERFSSIGPTVGSELATNAIYGIIGVVLAIILFVTFAFRKVSEPVSSWVYGSTAIAALIHDILVPTAMFAILGAVLGAQVDLLFVMALLAILGFSVNDTIVVFDRIRENLSDIQSRNETEEFSETVGRSLTQTYARSINTSLTTLIVLLTLFLLGGESTELFALTLLVGVIAGTYSSIFLASPLLVWVREKQKESS